MVFVRSLNKFDYCDLLHTYLVVWLTNWALLNWQRQLINAIRRWKVNMGCLFETNLLISKKLVKINCIMKSVIIIIIIKSVLSIIEIKKKRSGNKSWFSELTNLEKKVHLASCFYSIFLLVIFTHDSCFYWIDLVKQISSKKSCFHTFKINKVESIVNLLQTSNALKLCQ